MDGDAAGSDWVFACFWETTKHYMIKTTDSVNQTENPIPPAQYDETEEWVKDYIDQFGEEPSFF